MSVFKMRYTVRFHNGTEQYNVDMLDFIKTKGGSVRFSEQAGVAFETTRISSDVYFGYKFHERRHFGHITSRIGEFGNYDTMYYISSCEYVVIDGWGRVVHPDVFVNAFLEIYPILDKHIYYYWSGGKTVMWDRKTNNGWKVQSSAARAPRQFRCGGKWRNGRRHTSGVKKLRYQMLDNKRPEYTEDGVRVPSIRIGDSHRDIIGAFIEWEHNHRFGDEQRNWKKYRKTQYRAK